MNIEYEWISGFRFPKELVDIICTGIEPDAQECADDQDITEVTNMIDIVYENDVEDETE